MQNIGIVTNFKKDENLCHTKSIINYLLEKELNVLVKEDLAKLLNDNSLQVLCDNFYEKIDMLIILGGDGTLLHEACPCAKANIPILGINLGTLGFLIDIEIKNIFEELEKVFSNNYTLQERMMLEVFVNGQTYYALNDLCVLKTDHVNTISANIKIDEIDYGLIRADGIMVSTPTGSTAYNLSAGGPLLVPTSQMMILNTICPHDLTFRPWVFGDNEKISIELVSDCHCIIDGKINLYLQANDYVKIEEAKLKTKLIKTTNNNFYEIFRKKMISLRN